VDKSFEGLLLSIFLHIALILLLWNAKFPESTPHRPTEVTFIERPTNKKAKLFVTETHPKEIAETTKDEADYLSQFTKRVKKQMRAINFGPTVNSMPNPVPKPQPQKAAGLREQQPGEGLGPPGGNGAQEMKVVAIGPSSLSEYIPGVEQGAFTALNTNQFTYYTFFQRMSEQVRNRWIPLVRNFVASRTPQQLDLLSKWDRVTVVEIILGPGGQYVKSIMHSSSGDQSLDELHAQAFAAAAPFPNPPRGIFEPDGFIHLQYQFILQFHPPSFSPASN
jgi:hypothetical protein